jgi:hypothetical protein
VASTQALASPANYLSALQDDVVAFARLESTKGSATSTILSPKFEPIADVSLAVRELSERSDALLSFGEVDKGTLVTPRPLVPEVKVPPIRKFTKGTVSKSPRAPRVVPQIAAYAAPIEVFEGTVRSVNLRDEIMYVTLTSKTRDVSDHSADISFAWVNPQDLDLIAPGAVFYLSLYKEWRNGTIRNTEELRFRRMPTWTRTQIARVKDDAERLYSKLQSRPLLEEE